MTRNFNYQDPYLFSISIHIYFLFVHKNKAYFYSIILVQTSIYLKFKYIFWKVHPLHEFLIHDGLDHIHVSIL